MTKGNQEISPEVRRLLATRCRSRRTRTAEFSRSAPTEWQPRTLRDPRHPEEYFTDESAWEFVAECLDGGCPVEIVDLRHPPGKKAYVFKVAGISASDVIYVKLQLGSETVIGRSFHKDYPVKATLIDVSVVVVERRKDCK